MPLNIQENEEQSFQEKSKSEPILHTPSGTNRLSAKIIGIIFGAIVLAAIGFLLYTYGVIGGRQESSGVATSEQSERAGQSAQQIPEPSEAQSNSQVNSSAVSSANARYTVYIASYRSRSDAEEEVARWTEAGYEAFVREYDGWFRVALGHYNHLAEARDRAEGLKESFEQG